VRPHGPLAAEHLLLRMRPVNRVLRAAAERQAAEAALLDRPDLTPYCIPDEQVRRLLDRVERPGAGAGDAAVAVPTDDETAAERLLRTRADAAGVTLPLDELENRLGLSTTEVSGLLLCAAPEIDRRYERIYAYILDDLNRRVPCVGLLCEVLAPSTSDRIALAPAFGPAGPLRRWGLLQPWGEAPTEARQELRCAPGLTSFLAGSPVDLTAIAHDPGTPDGGPAGVPPHVDLDLVARIGRVLADRTVDLVGVWGARSAGTHEVARAIAGAAGMPMRQVPPTELAGPDAGTAVRLALRTAAALGAILWIPADRVAEGTPREHVAQVLAHTRTPVCLCAVDPWRPPPVLAARSFAEIVLDPPGYRHRLAMWSAALPGLARGQAEDLAARYRFSGDDLHTITALVRADGYVSGRDPADGKLNGALDRAVAAVTHRMGGGLTRPVVPRRSVHDLVLPEAQHRQLAEVAAACLAWPKIAEVWGFGGYAAGKGVKVLFTGEPGTGKTLAAEVIAGTLGLLLLKVDLARVVSKWVGETEKNLEAAFQQAEESQAVLFFDEADALFAKRGDIRQGIDRYANLEVGYLLQRLEQSDAVVILASNLREQVDAAFTRRFHYIVNFPRPGRPERERIWRIAFPPDAPIADDVDVSFLAALDMNGAGISAAARTAALLAAEDGGQVIDMAHVVQAIRRQYDRDARLLRPEELGPYAHLAEPA
jgi:AAA+ superfamily predicted ATPase